MSILVKRLPCRRMNAVSPVFIGHQFSPSLVQAAQGDRTPLVECSPAIGAIDRQRVEMVQEQPICNVTQTWEERKETHLGGAQERLMTSRGKGGMVAGWQGGERKGRVEYVVEPLGTSSTSMTGKGSNPPPLAHRRESSNQAETPQTGTARTPPPPPCPCSS